MKRFDEHVFDPARGRLQWSEYDALLKSKAILKEAEDVLPFFRGRDDLPRLIGNYFPNIRDATAIAHEFQIYGDFRADLVVGDPVSRHYLLVEFEDGSPESIFKRGTKAVPDWAPRFEGAFSQLIDWLWKLEDMRNTSDFEHVFKRRDVKFEGLIIAGKNMALDPQEETRLRWRVEKVVVDSKKISCVSFDQLARDLDYWLSNYHNV
jgi:Domain of unknown function (DUF4263)